LVARSDGPVASSARVAGFKLHFDTFCGKGSVAASRGFASFASMGKRTSTNTLPPLKVSGREERAIRIGLSASPAFRHLFNSTPLIQQQLEFVACLNNKRSRHERQLRFIAKTGLVTNWMRALPLVGHVVDYQREA
jgi:hypothetical protein